MSFSKLSKPITFDLFLEKEKSSIKKHLLQMKMHERFPLSATNRLLLFIFLAGHFAFSSALAFEAFNKLLSHNLHHMRVEVKQTNTFFILLLTFAKEYPSNNIKGHLSIEAKVWKNLLKNGNKQKRTKGKDWWLLMQYFDTWKIWNIC